MSQQASRPTITVSPPSRAQHRHSADSEAPDSAIDMSGNSRFGADMDAATLRGQGTATINHDGVSVIYTLQQITKMGDELAKARAKGLFPPTKAAALDVKATAEDYLRLVALTEARGAAPREDWNKMPNVVELLVRIHREIRVRDKVAAEESEEERVNAHVTNMMSGVGAEAKLYSIVQHAVTYAIKNGSGDETATAAGQNMASLLHGIHSVIKKMAGEGTHGVHDVNVDAVLEDVFGMIEYALGQNLDGHVKQMDGQLNRVDGQIMHLNAIGQHVNAIDGHVHSLGNNLNSMGTLLNSTNGNVISLNTQINLLQTIVNMLPRMIAEALQERLPEVVHSATSPIIEAFEAHYGISLSPRSSPFGTEKKSKTKKFFKSFSSGLKKLFK